MKTLLRNLFLDLIGFDGLTLSSLKNKTNIWIFILLGILIVIYKLYRSRIKGLIGETAIAVRLSNLPKPRYKVINNLVLENGDRTSQIDHLIVSDYGLFVIETKNLKGWIFGFENSEYWTQVIYKRKEYIYNPIRQNRGHIMALRQALSRFPRVTIIPIVVFSSSSTLKVKTTSEVIYSSELLQTVRDYSDITLSLASKMIIFETLCSANISHRFNRKAHIKSIKQRINERRNLISQDVCPHCKGSLIVRDGNFGRFKGCSNFPKCKFTVNMN
ncbi:MAG TPA: NERD domain-containing protein [Pedobacter sp.]|nr:NERD domain-containing protein [Pedobacter sp.]